MIRQFILVAAGGGLGSMFRYGISQFVQNRVSAQFPFGTLAVNILGCFIIGALYALAVRGGISANARLFFATGLCGGFTTFSAFSHETVAMLRDGQYLFAGLYISASVVCGIIATMSAIAIIK